MASNWNAITERRLRVRREVGLTPAEEALLDALARQLLGWRRTEAQLGERLLMEVAGITYRRDFTRARDGLVAKGLLAFEPGGQGRGKRAWYRLVLDPTEKRGPTRAFSSETKARATDRKSAGQGRARIGSGIGKDTPPTPVAKEPAAATGGKADLRPFFDAYLGSGGRLEVARHHDVLAGQVARLLRKGIDEPCILAACKEAGDAGDWPGSIARRAEAIAADGGPCKWERLGRSRLTVAQLRECGCHRCEDWAAHLDAGVTA